MNVALLRELLATLPDDMPVMLYGIDQFGEADGRLEPPHNIATAWAEPSTWRSDLTRAIARGDYGPDKAAELPQYVPSEEGADGAFLVLVID